MSLQAYYDGFRAGGWAEESPKNCPCHGSGWALSQVDTWHKCPAHYNGQRHPEDESPDEDECDTDDLDYEAMAEQRPGGSW